MLLASSSYSYPLLGAFWTIFEIFLWVIWFWILITIFIDIFRSRDLSGGAKALWFLFVLLIPLIGVLVYLIVRGGSMHERAVQQAHTGPAFRSLRPGDRGSPEHRRISWPSWPTCATGASSRPRSSTARRPRSWPEQDRSRPGQQRDFAAGGWPGRRPRTGQPCSAAGSPASASRASSAM